MTRLQGIMATAALAVVTACASTRETASPGARTGPEPTIRVLVLSTGAAATIATTGAYRAVGEDGAILLASNRGGTIAIERSGRALEIRTGGGEQNAETDGAITIEPTGDAALSAGGVWYSGRIRVALNASGNLDLVNLVPLETYLEGVVPHEIGEPGADGYAAVEAQAVAARTYALSRMALHRDEPFDVEAGVADQVYRGREKQSRLASAAVRDTRGVALRFSGRLCDTYYSATCGGHTSDIRQVWPDRPSAPYLFGCLDRDGADGASFCAAARNFRWRNSFTGLALGRTIRQTIPAVLGVPAASVGDLVDLRVLERSASGRVTRLEIETSNGTFVVERDRIRRVIMLDVANGKILPSTLFDVEKRMTEGRVGWISFFGGGNGHGVGMCQNGAIGMAKRGYSYAMILEHYYPGAEPRAGY